MPTVKALKVWHKSQFSLMFHKLLNLKNLPGLCKEASRGLGLDAASQELLRQLGRARRPRRKRLTLQRLRRQERLQRHEERGQELPGRHQGEIRDKNITTCSGQRSSPAWPGHWPRDVWSRRRWGRPLPRAVRRARGEDREAAHWRRADVEIPRVNHHFINHG